MRSPAGSGQLCDALDHAHNHAKVIHRDLKPANLMVNKRGDLKVADFGIARSLADSASRLTAEQGRSGTLVYMSPQQLSGDRGSHLDDIYSLGAAIYELLTSKPPFYSGNIDRQICEQVAPSMSNRRTEFDVEPASVSHRFGKRRGCGVPGKRSRRGGRNRQLRSSPPATPIRVSENWGQGPGQGLRNRKPLLINCHRGDLRSHFGWRVFRCLQAARQAGNAGRRRFRKNQSPFCRLKIGAKRRPMPTLPKESRTRF